MLLPDQTGYLLRLEGEKLLIEYRAEGNREMQTADRTEWQHREITRTENREGLLKVRDRKDLIVLCSLHKGEKSNLHARNNQDRSNVRNNLARNNRNVRKGCNSNHKELNSHSV